MTGTWKKDVLMQELVRVRRDLHKMPEPGLEEVKTQEYILSYLRSCQPDEIKSFGTGVRAVYYGLNKKRTVAFRADMDGLHIEEKTGVDFASQHPGLMHACGHDGHMAVLLVLAQLLHQVRLQLPVNVALIFQPAEESVGGAKNMIQAGALSNPDVNEIYALHLMPELPSGRIGCRTGTIMAQTSEFDIIVHGKSAHGAMPHRGIDAIVAASQIINQMQIIPSRYIDAQDMCLVTIGKMQGGTRRNILADEVTLEGIFRTLDDDVYGVTKKCIRGILKGVEEAFGVQTEYREVVYYPPVYNHAITTEKLKKAAGNDYVEIAPMLIAEDFSYYQKEAKGTYFFLGCGDLEKGHVHPLHASNFQFDESVLWQGLQIYLRLAGL